MIRVKRQIMPFRFDPTSQKAVEDKSTVNTQQDLALHEAPRSSHGQLLPPPGTSHSQIPASKMDRSRHRTTLGEKLAQPDLLPILKKGAIIISLIVVVLAVIIYAVSQQYNFNQSKGGSE